MCARVSQPQACVALASAASGKNLLLGPGPRQGALGPGWSLDSPLVAALSRATECGVWRLPLEATPSRRDSAALPWYLTLTQRSLPNLGSSLALCLCPCHTPPSRRSLALSLLCASSDLLAILPLFSIPNTHFSLPLQFLSPRFGAYVPYLFPPTTTLSLTHPPAHRHSFHFARVC